MHKSRFRFFVLPILLLALLLPLCTGVHGADLGVERSVFQFLTAELGLNSAAACGVLANIEAESNFSLTAYGDGGTSYGLCQWLGDRRSSLVSWCTNNALDYTTLTGQLKYMQHELGQMKYLELDFYLMDLGNTEEDAYNAARNFFATRSDTTAVFAMSDMVAMGVIRALKDISRRVPEDVSVVGFDGVEMGKYFIPSLSTIVQPQEEIARQSVDVLLDMMEKDGSARHLTVTAAPLLRESIASPRR